MTSSVGGSYGRARNIRLAETVAAELRAQILNGSLTNGSLPKQEELMATFGVSGPSLREALRILEVEGLVTVRRGKFGGAEVHRPNGASAAHAIGMTLQGESTDLRNLGEAILLMEPLAAEACAAQQDRGEALATALDENLDVTQTVFDEGPVFTHLCREFHEIVVDHVANPAIRIVVRSLVSVWSAQEETWATEVAGQGHYPKLSEQRSVLQAHRQIRDHILQGNPAEAKRLARAHLEATQLLVLKRYGDRIIDAASPRAVGGFQNATRRDSRPIGVPSR